MRCLKLQHMHETLDGAVHLINILLNQDQGLLKSLASKDVRPEGSLQHPADHPCRVVYLFTKGEGEAVNGNEPYWIFPGCILVLEPGEDLTLHAKTSVHCFVIELALVDKIWPARECDEHGLITVDEDDLTHCPAPGPGGQGRCGKALSQPSQVFRFKE